MTSGAIDSYTETTSFAAVEFSISCSTDGDPNSQCDSLTEVITSFPVTDTTYLSYTGSTSTLELTEILSTEVQVAELVTEIVTDGISTKVTLESIKSVGTMRLNSQHFVTS